MVDSMPAGSSQRPDSGRFPLIPWILIPALLAGLLSWQTGLFRAATCETYDEFTYLQLGVRVFQHDDFRSLSSPMTPPLPILLEYWLPGLRARFDPGTEAWELEVPELTRQARFLTSTTIGIPLILVVYAWLARRRGWIVGTLGGGLTALSPTILAASSIAATDACFALFAVVAVAALHQYQVRPSWRSYLVAGGGIGLALAAKQSAVILFPVALVELLLQGPPKRQPNWTGVDFAGRWLGKVACRLLGLIVLAFLIDWALYGFHSSGKFGAVGVSTTMPVIVPMVANLFPGGDAIVEAVRNAGPPLAYDTFVGQMNHAADGHSAFLMGQHSRRGWWYFFPVAIAIKSTPAELVLIGLVVALASRRATWRDPARRLWLVTAATMLGAGMASSINIGQRYVILIYPLVILLAADWIGSVPWRRSRWPRALGGALLAWQAVSAATIAPHYLSYFNSFCGGPMAGYRYLVDSSLDWGQDLPYVRRELEVRGYNRVALCYFGTAQARVYGLRAVDWTTTDEPTAAATDWLAISASGLQGAYGGRANLHERFKGFPSVRAGYSIFLYDLKDPTVRAAWDAIRSPNLEPPAR